MDKLEEMLTKAESQEESNEQWEHLDRYETKEYYADEHGYTRINNKSIEDISENISVSGENNSQYIEFRMNRFYDGVDLSEMVISVFYEAGGVGDEGYVINAYRNSEELKFGWVVPSSVTQYHEIQLCVWVRGVLEDGSDYTLKTLPKVYTISPGLNIGGTIPEPEENWYLNFVRVMDEKVSQASESADRAVQAASSADGVVEIVTTARDEVVQKSSTINTQHSEVESWCQEVEQFRNEAEQFRDEAFATTPDGYMEVVKNVEKNTIKIDTIIEKAELNIKNNASGENIHLTDSANSKVVEFGLYGKAEQKQYSGKNLYNLRSTDIAKYGISVTVNDDETLSASGTATANVNISLFEDTSFLADEIVQGGTFIMSLKNATYDSATCNISLSYKETEDGATKFITSALGAVSIPEGSIFLDSNLYVLSGKTVYLNNFSIQLERANEATDFEPFVGGIPSPNPDYPQEITVSGSDGSVEVVSCGKNLLENMAESETKNGVVFTVNSDYGSVTVTGIPTNTSGTNSFLIGMETKKLLPNTEYVYSIQTKALGRCNVVLSKSKVSVSSGNYKVLTGIASGDTECSFSFTEEDMNKYPYIICQVSVYYSERPSGEVYYPMISVDGGEYEPYKETTSTIPTPNGLCGIKVSNGGNYTDENGQQWICDEVVKYADGSGKRIQRIGKAVLNGSEGIAWTVSDNGIRVVAYCKPNALWDKHDVSKRHDTNILCNCLIGGLIDSNKINRIYIDQNWLNVSFDTGYLTSSDELNAWLTNNNLEFWYKLAEPIITDLIAEEIAEIEKLHTFYPITNISNDVDCGMSVTYLADAKNYIDNRLALIESAMLNNI